MIRIAIQKSGRLHEQSVRLLEECGLRFSSSANSLKVQVASFPAELLFLRDDDIPQYVADGVADVGLVGQNVVAESGARVREAMGLQYGRCRLSLAIPRHEEYSGNLAWFTGKRIATSYPNILSGFFRLRNIEVDIHTISGSVEIAPSIGLADAICDIVSTGSTLFSNGLKEVEPVFSSEAVAITPVHLDATRQTLLDTLFFRIRSVNEARGQKYVLMNCPNDRIPEIISVLPGMKSPTVLPLATEGWSSLHTVCPEQDFWSIINRLRQAGAEGILVVPIEKMIR